MQRTSRLFEIIQILRSENRVITAAELSERLEVSCRTIYRDIQTLQTMNTPIDGEAGVGYLLRRGYDLPALNFSEEELEAIVVGLSLVAQTGDVGLQKAARRVSDKIDSIRDQMDRLQVSEREPLVPQAINTDVIRRAIRDEQKLSIQYRDENDQTSQRTLKPLAIIYYVHAMLLVSWCELRNDFRHFRLDRMTACELIDQWFKGDGNILREDWQRKETE